MKLLMISGDRSLAAGKQGAFYNTLEEFHQYWDRIDIICPRTDKVTCLPTGRSITQGLALQRFGNVFVYPSPWPLYLQPFWIWKKGLEIYHEQKFNLVTVHEYPPFYNGIGARLLWQKIKVPYILEVHHIPGYPRASGMKEKIYKKLMGAFIKYDSDKAMAVRVVNENQVPDFLKRAGVPEQKIKCTPSLYIDLDIFRPMNLAKEYDLIFLGRLTENKGINLFLEAVRKLNAKAIISGDGPLKKSLKLENKITIHRWARDSREVAELINKSKILVFPSFNEGNPRVVVEAMACGVPVLATPVGIVPDIIKDKESGRIIDWNAEDIAVKARELLSNEEEYKRLKQAGLEIVKNFEKKAAIKNYADKLKELI